MKIAKSFKKLFTLILSFVYLGIVGCTSKGLVLAKEVQLGEQSISAVKATVQGKWKLQYSYGGVTGNIRVDYPNTNLLFTSSDSLYRWDHSALTIASPISYAYGSVYINNYSTNVIQIQDPANMMFNQQVAYSKKGDTLILAEPHSNPEKYFLTKLN